MCTSTYIIDDIHNISNIDEHVKNSIKINFLVSTSNPTYETLVECLDIVFSDTFMFYTDPQFWDIAIKIFNLMKKVKSDNDFTDIEIRFLQLLININNSNIYWKFTLN
jgi:hypothetical protein